MKTSGTVRWFNNVAGFGFITIDNHGTDIFVYSREVKSSGLTNLHEGQRLSFDRANPRGQEYAVNLMHYNADPSPAVPVSFRKRFWHLDRMG
ncbi:MAG: cold-shock protein [Cyanobacteria bacterium PR.023]|nr:cold-shock protein [Cyanobacteria bacterium PR.023]